MTLDDQIAVHGDGILNLDRVIRADETRFPVVAILLQGAERAVRGGTMFP